MKSFIKLLIVSLLIIRGFSLPQNEVSAATYIPDENFKQCLKDRLGITDNPEISQLNGITGFLDCQGRNITSIEGAEHLTGVTLFYFPDNQISDISFISGLTSLRRIYLTNNLIKDISPLSNLSILQQLYLGNNQIDDISPLSNLTLLSRLELQNNQISNISSLNALTNLTNVNLSNQSISLVNKNISVTPYKIVDEDLPIITNIDNSPITYELTSNQIQSFVDGETKALIAIWNESVTAGIATTIFNGEITQLVTYVAPLLIDAGNFTVNIKDINNLTDALAKSNSGATAKKGIVDLTNDITVDLIELNKIKDTASKGVFDLTFKIDDGSKSAHIIVKVYVVDDNDVVDTTDDIVLMANDFSVNLSEVRSYNSGVLDSGVVAYKYSDGSELPTSNITVDETNIKDISTAGVVDVLVTYNDGVISKSTTVKVTVVDDILPPTGNVHYIVYILFLTIRLYIIKRKTEY